MNKKKVKTKKILKPKKEKEELKLTSEEVEALKQSKFGKVLGGMVKYDR